MEQFIKDLILALVPLLPDSWEKTVFHGFFSAGTYDFSLYVRKKDETEFRSVLDLVEDGYLTRIIVREKYTVINSICTDALKVNPPNTRWKGITLIFNDVFHFSVQYEYEETNISHMAEWINNNLI